MSNDSPLQTPSSAGDDKALIEIQITTLNEVIIRHLSSCSDEAKREVLELFYEIRYHHRLHRLIEKENIEALWSRIRTSDPLTDITLEITTDWRFLGFKSDDHYERVTKQLATAVGGIGIKESLIDDSIKERMAGAGTIPLLLKHNIWLTMLIMSRYSEYLTELVKQNHE